MDGNDQALSQEDARHLDLLATFHAVVAALAGLFALFPIIHLAVGVAMLTGALEQNGRGGPPMIFAIFFVAFPLLWMLFCVIVAIALLHNRSLLQRRQRLERCRFIAGFACLFMPPGTILGVFTLVLLSKPAVARAFDLPPSASELHASGKAFYR